MKKFKVGDRVYKARPYSDETYCCYGGEERVPIGTEGEIYYIDSSSKSITVAFDNTITWTVDPSEIELVGSQTKTTITFAEFLKLNPCQSAIEWASDNYSDVQMNMPIPIKRIIAKLPFSHKKEWVDWLRSNGYGTEEEFKCYSEEMYMGVYETDKGSYRMRELCNSPFDAIILARDAESRTGKYGIAKITVRWEGQ